MRSKLFVPGSRPELFAKALAGDADALSFDLEDSVVQARKAEARTALATWLRSGAMAGSDKTIIVRVNAPDTPHFVEDIAAVALPGVALINIPKPESAEQIVQVARALEAAESANGVAQPIGLLLNVETPRALRLAAQFAQAHPRVAGLQLGLADLFEPLGIHRRESAAIQAAMFTLRMAAGEAGVFAYDAAFADVRDQAGYSAEAALAQRMGFLGKSCIHPSQVALANAAFRPTDAEIADALRVVEAARTAMADGAGAFLVEGKMIDPPFYQRALAIVATARRLGLVPG